jgi:hypothetical protein
MNSVSISGFVVHKWKYGSEYFLRLAVPRSPALPAKLADEDQDGKVIQRNTDFVSVRLPPTLFGGAPVDFRKSDELEVTGYIQSRDYYENLERFLQRAGKPQLKLDGVDPGELAARRSAVEVVALSVTRIENGRRNVRVMIEEPLVDGAPVKPPN